MSSDFTEKSFVDFFNVTNQEQSANQTGSQDLKTLACLVCGVHFLTEKDLQQHYVEHIAVKPYKCIICDKSFLCERKLKKHELKHTDLKYECDICKKRFSKKLKYEIQCRKHGTEHLCDSCCELFSLKSLNELNDLIHHDCDACNQRYLYNPASKNIHGCPKLVKSFLCVICKKRFNLREDLVNHTNSHVEQRIKFTCNLCNKDYHRFGELNAHEKNHLGFKMLPDVEDIYFPCKICKETFSDEEALEAHYNNHHVELTNTKYECPVCKKDFFFHFSYKAHVDTHALTCSHCLKQFANSNRLKAHKKLHNCFK